MTTVRRESTASVTQARIQELMVERGLHPGDPMPTESELCESLGVSRSSIREAMRTLTALDIVDVRHGHGTFVGNMSLEPFVQAIVFRGTLTTERNTRVLREVVEFREALDTGLAEPMCMAFHGTTNPRMSGLVDEMVKLSRSGERFAEQDRLFHQLLLEAQPNQLIGQMVTALWDIHMRIIPRLHVPSPKDIFETAQAHGAMLAAAEAGDPEAYRSAVADHYAPLRHVLERESVSEQNRA